MFEQRAFIAFDDVEREIELYALGNVLQPTFNPASSASIGIELSGPVAIALFGSAIVALIAFAG